MHFSNSFLRSAILSAVVALLSVITAQADKSVTLASSPANDLFEVSLGYNYIHQGDAYPETKNLHGFDVSAFVNAMPWLSLGGEFMGDFGTKSYQFFRSNIDVDSTRLVYVFGPRFIVWHNSQFKAFAEVLAGGVHANADVSLGSRSASVSDDGFAMAIGGGFDWRFADHFSWRVIQADYLPTHLGGDWQNNLRLSSGIVYSFGGR
jgi:opacity protein-like surface antigen